jgi:hypothetical protein
LPRIRSPNTNQNGVPLVALLWIHGFQLKAGVPQPGVRELVWSSPNCSVLRVDSSCGADGTFGAAPSVCAEALGATSYIIKYACSIDFHFIVDEVSTAIRYVTLGMSALVSTRLPFAQQGDALLDQ